MFFLPDGAAHVGEERVRGDPCGPGGPPYLLSLLVSFLYLYWRSADQGIGRRKYHRIAALQSGTDLHRGAIVTADGDRNQFRASIANHPNLQACAPEQQRSGGNLQAARRSPWDADECTNA